MFVQNCGPNHTNPSKLTNIFFSFLLDNHAMLHTRAHLRKQWGATGTSDAENPFYIHLYHHDSSLWHFVE